MIKSKLNKKVKDNSYPCLKESLGGQIVLFSSPCCGTLLQGVDGGALMIGHVSKNWAEDYFINYNGNITLYNKTEVTPCQ